MVGVTMGQEDELQVHTPFIDQGKDILRVSAGVNEKSRPLIIPHKVTVGP
jgi:hypothetical protein